VVYPKVLMATILQCFKRKSSMPQRFPEYLPMVEQSYTSIVLRFYVKFLSVEAINEFLYYIL